MRSLLACWFLSLMALSAAAAEPAESSQEARSLFDGKTFTGWEGNRDWFRIEDGAIVAGTHEKPIPQNEFLCTTEEFENFELRLKARLVGKGDNAGIQFRSRRIPNHHEVIGYQCDMGQGNGRSIWGSLYDESRRRKFLAEGDADQLEKVLQADDWNELVIRCEGARVQIWVNGYQTVDYTEEDREIPRTGIIGLQIHSGPPAEAWYRDISLIPLGAN